MQLLLDTDILSLLRKEHEKVVQHATEYLMSGNNLAFTELTWYEVVRGYRAIKANRQLEIFMHFCQYCDIFSLNRISLDRAASIYADLHQRGALIGEVDILNAAIALVNRMGIVTRNIGHYSRITGLHIENWVS